MNTSILSRKTRRLLALLAMLTLAVHAPAQRVALKTNLAYDVTTTFNLGVELSLAPKWTLDVSGNYNPWTFSDNKKWKHWLVQPEARYWFCNKMMGSFLGFHVLGGQYNVGGLNADFTFLGTEFSELKNHRFEGWAIGAGIAYGFAWPLSRHWNMEAEIGIGYAFSRYDKFKCEKCGEKVETGTNHHYVGPTKAAVNLVYVF